MKAGDAIDPPAYAKVRPQRLGAIDALAFAARGARAVATLGRRAIAREVAHAQDAELLMAGSVLTVLPVLLFFLALRHRYVEGITLGGVKE